METERERLLSRLKKEIKLLMEESVTKKFIHEDSSTIASLCIVLESCLVHGYFILFLFVECIYIYFNEFLHELSGFVGYMNV